MISIHNLPKTLKYPLKIAKSIVYRLLIKYYPKGYASCFYHDAYHRWLNWEHPRDINEKIAWLRFNSDTSQWVKLADKFRVREYIHEKGLDAILPKLYGRWERAEDINWDSLPSQFVLKTNNGSGDILVCKDKDKIDKQDIVSRYAKLLEAKYSSIHGERHYDLMKPCIIAEELLDVSTQPLESSSLVDYKIWCFDGQPKYIWVCHNRRPHCVQVGVYDLDWNFHPECSVSTDHYILSDKVMPRPASLQRMIEVAAILSKGFPQVRCDLYEVNGKVYFGELTFTSSAGLNVFYTQEFLNELGDYCKLPS